MVETPRPIRGCHDLLPSMHHTHRHVINQGFTAAQMAGFDWIDTPIMEETRLFDRGLGASSDVVGKEMYRFTTRGGEEVSLRPENTAGIVRAYFSQGLAQQVPLRYFYAGPMFRYERPQKGRLRQFHQLGAELIGAENPQTSGSGALADLEIIVLGADILRRLGLQKQVTLHINTLGSSEDRAAYRQALIAYFSQYRAQLSEDSQRRLDSNPMRILDSKAESDWDLLANAPDISDFLQPESLARFRAICAQLDDLGITYQHDPHLVRGLDYYEHTAFEFISDALGAQGTVLGGGCYNRLFDIVGGKQGFGVGFAAGIERLSALCQAPALSGPDCVLIPIGQASEQATPKLAQQLRQANIRTQFNFSGKVKARLKQADQIGARFALLYGEEEWQHDMVTCKTMHSGHEEVMTVKQFIAHFANLAQEISASEGASHG